MPLTLRTSQGVFHPRGFEHCCTLANGLLAPADPFYAEFEVAGPLYHLLNSGLTGGYSSSQVQPEYR